MTTIARRFGVYALAVAGLAALEAAALAQFTFRPIPSAQSQIPLWQNRLVAPGLNYSQYLSMIRAYNRTIASAPPWVYGYNPYRSPIISTGPVINPGPVGPGFGPGFNPYNPISGGGVVNPYNPIGGDITPGLTNPYSPVTGGLDSGYNPALYGGGYGAPIYGITGGTLVGAADVMRAQGSMWTSAEQARIMREQAYQARLDTIRKKFDLDMYIKANTPTWGELEAERAVKTLKRIQDNASPGEVSSGRSLNILLDDLRKFPGKKLSESDIPMIEGDILAQLNVVGPGSSGSLGILRGGKLPVMPSVMHEVFTPVQLQDMKDKILEMYNSAKDGSAVDPNKAKEFRKIIDKAIDDLGKRISDISTSDYLNGKRFLTDLDQARIALERGDAKGQTEFQEWAKAGRSAQELADYLTKRGLKVAPSTLADESAYRAVHSALVTLDVQMHAQFASAGGSGPDYPKE